MRGRAFLFFLWSAALCLGQNVSPARTPIAGGWVSLGPSGAYVNVLAVDPTNPLVAYAGTVGAGLLMTRDGGLSWHVAEGLTNGSQVPLLDISVVAIDPTVPSAVYAGFGGNFSRSDDGGSTWKKLAWPNTVGSGQVFLADPATPGIVYAGTQRAILMSADRGSSWTVAYLSNSTLGGVNAITLGPDHIAYAGGGQDFGLVKSTDGGRSWSKTSLLIFQSLVADPNDAAVLYAGLYGEGVFKSVDGGATFGPVNGGLSSLSVQALLFEPATRVLYAGTDGGGIFRSADGGTTWSATSTGLTETHIGALAVAPSAPTVFYAGAQGSGIFRSTDAAMSWKDANGGFAGTRAQRLATIPGRPGVYAGIEGVDLLKTGAGTGWHGGTSPVPMAYFQSISVSPSDPSTIFVATFGGLFKSSDGGNSWTDRTPRANNVFIRIVNVDPTSARRVYCSTDVNSNGGFFVSDDGGDTWTLITEGLVQNFEVVQIAALAIDPSNSQNLYAIGLDSSIYKSSDGGLSWSQRDPGRFVLPAIAIDPRATQTIYVATDSGIAKSTDGAMSWTQSPQSHVVFGAVSILVDRANSNRIYAAGSGVFRSDDGGQTWTAMNAGLLTTSVTDLAQDPLSGTLYAATDGRGVFAHAAERNPHSVPPRK